jgi:hypothetical protein
VDLPNNDDDVDVDVVQQLDDGVPLQGNHVEGKKFEGPNRNADVE